MINSVERFSSKVANYIRYRPSYPQPIIDILIEKVPLTPASSIADIGAGTGIFSKLLLENNLSVTAIEPNRYMLAAAKAELSHFPDFRCLNNSAEQTGITSRSVDLICAAQSFHWFNTPQTFAEFSRILKPKGYLALIWNQREKQQLFQHQYDHILKKFATDYARVNHMNISMEQIGNLFAPGQWQGFGLHNHQQFDFAQLMGRIKTCSYCPSEDSDAYAKLSQAIGQLFAEHSVAGVIDFTYNSKLYLGRLNV